MARVRYVKEKIKNHAPRFAFTSEVTLQEILEMPEKVWLTELRAEKTKFIFRRRVAFNAMAYIATIESRRFRFFADMSSQMDGATENDSEWQDLDDIVVDTESTAAEDKIAMEQAHEEELLAHQEYLLTKLLRKIGKSSQTSIEEVLLDEDVEFIATAVDFGPLMTSDEFLRLLVKLRLKLIYLDAAEICGLDRPKLIELVKRVR